MNFEQGNRQSTSVNPAKMFSDSAAEGSAIPTFGFVIWIFMLGKGDRLGRDI